MKKVNLVLSHSNTIKPKFYDDFDEFVYDCVLVGNQHDVVHTTDFRVLKCFRCLHVSGVFDVTVSRCGTKYPLDKNGENADLDKCLKLWWSSDFNFVDVGRSFDKVCSGNYNSVLTIKKIADIINVPIHLWPGNCYYITSLILKHKIFNGRLQYGKYCGNISDDSIFSNHQFPNHAWIVDGFTIVDPTRWAFDSVNAPYVHKCDADDEDYDFGANQFRMRFLSRPPEFDKTAKAFIVPPDLMGFVGTLVDVNDYKISIGQLMWLSNLPIQVLGAFARPMYEFIVDSGNTAFIPIDNYTEILGGEM